MSKKDLYKRYFLFLCSIFINSFSIAVITKAALGTSPISSVPYVLSLFTPFTMGQYTIVMNFVFILLEIVFMTKAEVHEKRYELWAQVPITLCFGSFIDVSMHFLWWLEPTAYLSQIVTLLIGCVLLALGISLEVKANVAMVTGEYLVQVISRFVKREFGFIKVLFDVTLVTIACILGLVFMGRIDGVREGTIVAALIVGPITRFFRPYCRVFDHWLGDDHAVVSNVAPDGKSPIVVTIAREYGSGGHLLGEMLAKELGVKYYDKELISMVAKASDLPESYVAENEQSVSSNYLLNIILQDYEAPLERSLSSADALFVSQSRVIRQIARERSCVIIGRCADYILEDFPEKSVIRIFCYTDPESAYQRCVETYHLEPSTARAEIARINRARIAHYQQYTGRKWADPHNYNLMINTGSMSLPMACTLIKRLYEERLSAEA